MVTSRGCMQCSHEYMQAISTISDKWDAQVEVSIKAKGQLYRGSYKTRNGTEPEVIGAQYTDVDAGYAMKNWCWYASGLINVRRADHTSCTSHEAWNILAIYLVSLSGIADPSLTSEVASPGMSKPGKLDSYWLSNKIYSTGISVARFTIS